MRTQRALRGDALDSARDLLADAGSIVDDLFVLLSSHLTSLSLLSLSVKLWVIILLPRGVSLIWLSSRIMLGPTPDIVN